MADPFQPYRALLEQRQLRVTPQRLMILRVIDDGHGHLTADAIGERIREQFPAIHQGTIYRSLEVLRASGLVSETRLGDRAAVYELVGAQPHHHLVCERCGRVLEFDDDLLAPLRRALLDRYGFHARADHLALFGVCAECEQRLGK
jgi:Fe2+ or Zn2+ uptake regulation protein